MWRNTKHASAETSNTRSPRASWFRPHMLLPQEYASSKAVTIHYPPSQYLDDSARRSVLADLPGLRMSKNIQLQRESKLTSSAAFLAFRGTSQRLLLRIHNKARSLDLCWWLRQSLVEGSNELSASTGCA